jgi:hypothetical protein
MGLITAKVKATGQLFLVGIDLGTDNNPTWRDPTAPLVPDRWYAGNLLNGEVRQSQYVEYGSVEWQRFKGKELEEVAGDLRLVNVRLTEDPNH